MHSQVGLILIPKKNKPQNLQELTALVAALRPGFKTQLDNFLDRKPYSTGVKALDDLLEELDSLIGLDSVKQEVRNLINLLKIVELRTKNGLKAPSVTKHFVFRK